MDFDLEKFRLKNFNPAIAKPITPPRKDFSKYFLRGPIPLNWIIKLIPLSKSAHQMALVIWFICGLKGGRRTFVLSNKRLKEFKLDRQQKYRGLRDLERAALIKIKKRNGRQNPIITILDAQ